MKILYLIRTHQNPSQIYRLVKTIRNASPSSRIILSHSPESPPLDLTQFSDLPGHPIQYLHASVRRCDMSLTYAYLDALEWIYTQNIEFDWLVNLTGQCYPTQPLKNLERYLENTKYDGFLENFELFSGVAPWPIEQCQDRYLYHYWNTKILFSPWQLAMAKPLAVTINKIQNMIRLHWIDNKEFIIGKRVSTPFNQNFIGYGGSYFHVLSAKCVGTLLSYLKSSTGRKLVKFYERTLIPDESIFQTVLVNDRTFEFCARNMHYISWSSSNGGRPNIILPDHIKQIIESDDVFFARKFDAEINDEVLSMLDERIFGCQAQISYKE